jgi:transposase
MPKKIAPAIKAKLALEAIEGRKTATELSSQYGVAPNYVAKVKAHAIENLSNIFSQPEESKVRALEQEVEELQKLLGQKERDISWLKKKSKEMGLM